MDQGKFAADFLAANLDKIYGFGKKVYGKADAAIQVSLKTAYTDYLNASRLKHSKSKSFFIRNQPVELYSYYVPTSIACGNRLITKPNFKKCTDFTNRIVISGTGGSGKSVLMKHLFLDCIHEKSHTPILIELRDLNSYEKTLDDFVNESLSNFGFKTTQDYIKNAKLAGHFCYFFDGFDEISPKLRNKITREISSLSKKFPKCPIFISSRPDDTLTSLDEFSTFKMCPLELSEALELVGKLPFDDVIKDKFCSNLSKGLFEKHKSFLSNPLLLSIMLLTYGENAEIPSKLSIFYNQAFDALFRRHDAYKGAYSRDRLTTLDSQDFIRLFSLFSLQTYEKRLFKMPRSQCLEFIEKSIKILNINVDANDYLNDLLSAVCLLIEDGLEITFSHRSFQEYFVALYISTAAPEVQFRLIERFWINLNSDNVFNLLREINPDLYERALLVPKLEEFFAEIKVKNTIEIPHLIRYLKLIFRTVEYNHDPDQDHGMMFFFDNSKEGIRICQHRIVQIAVRDYSDYVMPTKEKINEDSLRMFKKHFQDVTEYEVNTLDNKSPIVFDLNANGSWYSVAYLSAAYSAFKGLKSKHTNTTQSFDILLGIK
ncbi:MAG TPA: NACHT domain-containing protein [Methylotenera sp.]|nr:NACHT domain-containing protein [Methylotenera sp.]